jgi:hypothetical protein
VTVKPALVLILLGIPLFAQEKPPCRWGLVPNTQCASLEKKAAERLIAAQTSCFSADSGVSWPKSLENPNKTTSFRWMDDAYIYAQTGYHSLASCRYSHLIFKFEIEKRDSVELEVTYSDSGDRVFYEHRVIADEDADLHRLGLHFLQAHQAAKVITETYRTAHQAGCTDDDVYETLAAYSDAELVGKHFACRDNVVR